MKLSSVLLRSTIAAAMMAGAVSSWAESTPPPRGSQPTGQQSGFMANVSYYYNQLKAYTDAQNADLFFGLDIASISSKLDLENLDTGEILEEETVSGLGVSTSVGAHIDIRGARITSGIAFMFDGIAPSEADDTFGANITKLSVFSLYDHQLPYTVHPNARFYVSGGLQAGRASYTNIHTLRWGYADDTWDDVTKFELTLIGSVTADYQINNSLALALTPFFELNFGFGTAQRYGARLSIRGF